MLRWNRLALACAMALLGCLKVLGPSETAWLGAAASRLIGVVELLVALGLYSRWGLMAGWLCVAIGLVGVTLGLVGWAETCGCAGPIKLSHAEHVLLASVIGTMGVGVATGPRGAKLAPCGGVRTRAEI